VPFGVLSVSGTVPAGLTLPAIPLTMKCVLSPVELCPVGASVSGMIFIPGPITPGRRYFEFYRHPRKQCSARDG
jgi:hypothetical protein